MSTWDVSAVTDMNHLFRTPTSNGNDFVDFNADISAWDVSSVTNMGAMFQGAQSFNQPLNSWNVSSVRNIWGAFDGALTFNQPLDSWDVSSVASMAATFRGALAFNQPIGNWNVASVTNMDLLFKGAESFNQPLNDWDVSSVRTMNAAFDRAYAFNQPLHGWDVSSVTSMFTLFRDAHAFNQPIGNWNVSSVDSFQGLFARAYAFNQPLNDWDVSSVTNFINMFHYAEAFAHDLSGWSTLPWADFANMFFRANAWISSRVAPQSGSVDGPPSAWALPAFATRDDLIAAVDACVAATVDHLDDPAHPLCASDRIVPGSGAHCCSLCGADCGVAGLADMPAWNTAGIADMRELFLNKAAFNVDLSRWNVSSGTTFFATFRGASAFLGDVTRWTLDAAANTSLMFEGADAWLAVYANCGHDAAATSACGDRGRFETRDAELETPASSSGALDGPPAAWRVRRPCAELDARGFTPSARVASFPCAEEGESCACPGGRVTYGQKFAGEDRPGSGAAASFSETRSRRHRVVDVAVDGNPVECSAASFARGVRGGDPRPGYDKRCWCSPSEKTCDALGGDGSSTRAGGCGRTASRCADLIRPGVVETACRRIHTTDPVFGNAFTVTCTPGGYFRAEPDQDTGNVYVRVEAPFAFDELTWSGAMYSSGGTGAHLVDGPEDNKRTVLMPTTNGGGSCHPNCMSTQGGLSTSDPSFEAVDVRVRFDDAATNVEWLAWSDHGNVHGGSGAYVQIDRLRVCRRTSN